MIILCVHFNPTLVSLKAAVSQEVIFPLLSYLMFIQKDKVAESKVDEKKVSERVQLSEGEAMESYFHEFSDISLSRGDMPNYSKIYLYRSYLEDVLSNCSGNYQAVDLIFTYYYKEKLIVKMKCDDHREYEFVYLKKPTGNYELYDFINSAEII